jgi:Glycosyl transferase 4-like domain
VTGTSSSLRILHIYKDYFPVLGGIENHVKVLAEAQAARRHDVTVVAANPERQTTSEMFNGVRVIKATQWAKLVRSVSSVNSVCRRWRSHHHLSWAARRP